MPTPPPTAGELARAQLLARANAARQAVAGLRADRASAAVIRRARDLEARAWSAYRQAARR